MAHETAIENVAHESRFARARHACYDSHDSEREAHVDVLEIVVYRTLHLNIFFPRTRADWCLDLFFAENEFGSIASVDNFAFLLVHIDDRPLIYNLSAIASGFRANVDEVVGSMDDLFVVFDHDDRIAHVAELAEHRNKLIGVARMKADGRLIENVH